MSAAAIVPAAGRGKRLGTGTPKALRELCGEPLLVHAVRSLWSSGALDHMVVAAPPGHRGSVQSMLRAAVPGVVVSVVDGGASRQQSVAAGLSTLDRDIEVVLVHDAARPLVPAALVRRVVAAVREGAAAVVPVLPVADTIKEVADHVVVATIDRSRLRCVQTPQGFTPEALVRAHASASRDATDDAGLVEALGLHVNTVEGAPEALKITNPFDLRVAEALLCSRRGDQ